MTATIDMRKHTSARKIFPIPGGVHPPQNKAQSNQAPLQAAPLPEQVCLPLNQHLGALAVPVVEVGDRVLTGQLIARANGFVSANVHASISGTISAIEDRLLPHSSGMSGPCIVIASDGQDEWLPKQANPNYLSANVDELISTIKEAGIIGLGGAGFPTAVKLAPKNPIKHLIINGTECEPYITADDLLMRTYPEEIIEGTVLLAKILGNPEDVVIGLEENKPEALAALRKAAEDTQVQVVSFPCQYPSGGEKQLIQRLTGLEVPSGGLPAEVGCAVQNVGTAYAALRAVKYGEPLVSRVTTVVGESLNVPKNLTVRLGTPVIALLEHLGFNQKKCSQLIMGGPMMGFALGDSKVPVVKTTNCIIAPTLHEMPPLPAAQACIRCGLCEQACPASLLPQQMHWYAKAEEYEKLEAHNLFDCIECGACSYVCPSRIPLVQYYRNAKGEIRQQREDKVKAERSRQRFEFRQERLAKAEAEKQAKRQARQKAAELAKAKKAQSADQVNLNGAAPAATGVDQIAKLERALSSAQTRLSSAQAKHQTAIEENSDRVDQLAAALKQSQLRVNEAQQKLAQAQAQNTPSSSSATPPPNDPVAAAIAKAQAKHAMTPDEKAKADVASLESRLAKAQAKLSEAERDNSDKYPALLLGVEKLTAKLEQARNDLAKIAPASAAPKTNDDQADPALAAIERAKAKAAAAALMSPQEKLTNQINSLETRLNKAQAKLAEAKTNQQDNQDALALGVSKLQAKLDQAKLELSQQESR